MSKELVHRFVAHRRNHQAWRLLVSSRAPLILASLKQLIDASPNGVDLEVAIEKLSNVFTEYANDTEFEFGDDVSYTARAEIRSWLKRGLIVERNGKIFATNAFQKAILFIESLDDSSMTSTASRLATVQRAIENLEAQLSPNQDAREQSLKSRIDALSKELKAVQAGKFEVLDGNKAVEGIREVYQLAISLQADFRRVEDSYREADKFLRKRILLEKHNRGEIVDELLDSHDALIQTVEGQVFESFHAQLVRSDELRVMKGRLKSILENANTERALQRKQKADLKQLVSRLVQESERVIQARARSEKDVRSFLKSGIADEQIRVGEILQEILQVATLVDWGSQKVRRSPAPLPPIAVSLANLPIPDRLLVKQIDAEEPTELDLSVQDADASQLDEEFWRAYHALNRQELFQKTLHLLETEGRSFSIGELAEFLPPTHDLETLAFWLAIARQAGLLTDDQTETVDLTNAESETTRFHVPAVRMSLENTQSVDQGTLE